MGGLIAATILTLTFLPALYALAFRIGAPGQSAALPLFEEKALPGAKRPLAAAA
jgi:hypothetical protein